MSSSSPETQETALPKETKPNRPDESNITIKQGTDETIKPATISSYLVNDLFLRCHMGLVRRMLTRCKENPLIWLPKWWHFCHDRRYRMRHGLGNRMWTKFH